MQRQRQLSTRQWIVGLLVNLLIVTLECQALDIVAPKLLGTAKKEATTSTSSEKQHAPTLLTATPPSTPTNIMTDENLFEAVEIWCNNPTLATKFFGPISQWNTSAVTNFRGLFRKQTNFNDDISQWDTSAVTSMAAMFEECTLFDGDLSGWDTANVLSMSAMFADATSFTGTKGTGMSRWNVEKVTRTDRMFQNCILFQGDLSHWKPLKLHHVAHMFHNAISYRGLDLANWEETGEFRDMSGMFQHAIRFEGNISRWNLSSALELDEMFHNSISFNGDLSRWNTSNVVTMARMFRNATKFTGLGNGGGIRQWNVESVRNFYAMFEDNPSFKSDISSWNLASAKNMERMFFNATAFGSGPSLKETITEQHATQASQFKLMCWLLPNAEVKTQDAFCGSSVRFDPCCATSSQFETSCCNRFCYNMTTTCQHPDHDHGAANQNKYDASSGSVFHDNDYDDAPVRNDHSHMRGEEGSNEKTSIGWEGIVMIVVLVVVMMCCFLGMVKFL